MIIYYYINYDIKEKKGILFLNIYKKTCYWDVKYMIFIGFWLSTLKIVKNLKVLITIAVFKIIILLHIIRDQLLKIYISICII